MAKRQTGILPLERGGGGGDDEMAKNCHFAAKIIPTYPPLSKGKNRCNVLQSHLK
jgi:hypothetical protein